MDDDTDFLQLRADKIRAQMQDTTQIQVQDWPTVTTTQDKLIIAAASVAIIMLIGGALWLGCRHVG